MVGCNKAVRTAILAVFCLAEPIRAAMAQVVPAVTVEPAAMMHFAQTASFNGRAVAVQKVEIRARISGFVAETGFTEGGTVEKDAVLFRIDPQEFQAALAQVDASLAAAKATETLALIERDRQRELVARQSAAQAQLDKAEAEAARASAEVQRVTAQRDAAALNLSYTQITAPFAGKVGLSTVHVGALIGPETGPLLTLVRTDPMSVEFPVPERELLLFQQVQKQSGTSTQATVHVTLADGSVYPLPGAIDFADVKVSPTTDSVMIRASFPNPEGILRDGALLTVMLEEQNSSLSLTVPQQAVLRDLSGAYVLAVDDKSTVEQRRIETGPNAKGRTVVTSGLSEGDLVITEGLNKVRPGVQVDAAVAGGN